MSLLTIAVTARFSVVTAEIPKQLTTTRQNPLDREAGIILNKRGSLRWKGRLWGWLEEDPQAKEDQKEAQKRIAEEQGYTFPLQRIPPTNCTRCVTACP